MQAEITYKSHGRVTNVASVPQLSPFRYPGGKTWLIPEIRLWLGSQRTRPTRLVEPFAGGGSVGLTALFENYVDQITLVELDEEVATVWQTILSPDARDFAEQIVTFELNAESVNSVLLCEPLTPREVAFRSLLKNRVRYGGILARGACTMNKGENGRGLSSRWYPKTLLRRILAIAERQSQIQFIHGDGIDYLRHHAEDEGTVFFVDPPYTVSGRRLYAHASIDHGQLFQAVRPLICDFLMTYDDAAEIRLLAQLHNLDIHLIPMKSTKHQQKLELLVGRDLDWARTRQDSFF
ncbi:MAG: DNA adenine methylase [Chloroflexi bacterium]|nr:DNA adenine methylase [Chloroflexota bacterium]